MEGVYVVVEVIRFTERLLNMALTSSNNVSLVFHSLFFYTWVIKRIIYLFKKLVLNSFIYFSVDWNWVRISFAFPDVLPTNYSLHGSILTLSRLYLPFMQPSLQVIYLRLELFWILFHCDLIIQVHQTWKGRVNGDDGHPRTSRISPRRTGKCDPAEPLYPRYIQLLN